MTREERAKQFMPFDAMKGLQEALRDREERHTRVEKKEISEEIFHRNSRTLLKVKKGMKVAIYYHYAFHDVEKTGKVTQIDYVYKYLRLDEQKIYFDDIYRIKITDI